MNRIRALIVDDSSVMRKIVERSLRQAGLDLAEVLEAGNGAEALAVVGQHAVDLILCDINMPVMDGIEFVRSLRSTPNAKVMPRSCAEWGVLQRVVSLDRIPEQILLATRYRRRA